MNFYLDPRRPHIDGATFRCPGCGQSYDTIVEGFVTLPQIHYQQPTNTTHRRGAVGTRPAGGQRGLCPFTDDDLVAHLFRAQLAVEQLEAEAAA